MNAEWAEPPRRLPLAAGEVHVWRAFLDVDEAGFTRMLSVLAPQERTRANRFRFPADRRRFVVARAVLRDVLAGYLAGSAADVSFAYGAQGKPALAASGTEWLHFNTSHSSNLALYAVAREKQVGIDVERVQPEPANWQPAVRFLAAGEIQALQRLDDPMRTDAFFACWTRKEAYLKARGIGLQESLDAFEVPVAPGQSASLVCGDSSWLLQSLPAGDGFAAACAAQGSKWRLRLLQWNPMISESLRTIRRSSAGNFQTAVRTVLPVHVTSRRRPTFTESRRANTASSSNPEQT